MGTRTQYEHAPSIHTILRIRSSAHRKRVKGRSTRRAQLACRKADGHAARYTGRGRCCMQVDFSEISSSLRSSARCPMSGNRVCPNLELPVWYLDCHCRPQSRWRKQETSTSGAKAGRTQDVQGRARSDAGTHPTGWSTNVRCAIARAQTCFIYVMLRIYSTRPELPHIAFETKT